ncbi:TPA: hypothetical protein R1805_001423 [Campylobacter jejuni]|nr:hypothetical protein [Campylobacter jejuni]
MATDATQKPFWDKVLQEAYRFYKILSLNEATERKKFINYLRYRLYSFANNILVQTETDTAKITTLQSVISKVQTIIATVIKDNERMESLKKDVESLKEDAKNLYQKCNLNYGIKDKEISTTLEEIEKRINFDDVNEIFKYKYKDGEFFDYTFLEMAAEIILVDEETRGNKTTRSYVGTMLTRLDYFINNPECLFMREMNNGRIKEVDKYLDYLWGQQTQLIIIDTSELGKDILETLTSVISRLIFEYRKKQKGENRQKNPVHLVLDEAHRYIKKD